LGKISKTIPRRRYFKNCWAVIKAYDIVVRPNIVVHLNEPLYFLSPRIILGEEYDV